jgi:hypothetical protein
MEHAMNAVLQNAIALAVAAVAGLWLARSLWRRLWAPPCAGPGQEAPPGSDGFVAVDDLLRK